MGQIRGLGYSKFIQDWVVPLSREKMSADKLPFNNLKYCLLNHVYDVDDNGDGTYSLHIDSRYIRKAILGEIELFQSRMLVQATNLVRPAGMLSSDWLFVTAYYSYFFAACTLLRFGSRGTTFLTNQNLRNIDKLLTAKYATLYRVTSGNCEFSVPDLSLDELVIKPTSRGAHESAWVMVEKLISEIHSNSLSNDDENLATGLLLSFQQRLRPSYPSETRNVVNYDPLIGLEVLSKRLSRRADALDQTAWFEELCRISVDDTLESKQECTSSLGRYLYALCMYSYEEYRSRSQSSLHSDLRKEYLKSAGTVSAKI